MNIQIRHYDRILLLNLDGLVAESDLLKVVGFVNTLASKLTAIVLDVHLAQLEPAVSATIFRLKKQYEKANIRFLVVAPELIGADSATLADAVDSIGSSESERITEIFAQDAELLEQKKQLEKARATLASLLGLNEESAPLSAARLNAAVTALEEKTGQMLHLFKTLSSEIHRLEGDGQTQVTPGADNRTAVEVAEAKRQALEFVKTQVLG